MKRYQVFLDPYLIDPIVAEMRKDLATPDLDVSTAIRLWIYRQRPETAAIAEVLFSQERQKAKAKTRKEVKNLSAIVVLCSICHKEIPIERALHNPQSADYFCLDCAGST